MLRQAILAVDIRTLTVVARWDAPQPFDLTSGMALDARRGRLYVAQPAAASITTLDTAMLTPIGSFGVGRTPGALALAPDGSRLFALDGAWLALSSDGQTAYVLQAGASDTSPLSRTPQLWRIDVSSGRISGPIDLPQGEPPWDLLRLDDGHLAIPRGNGRTGGITIVATSDFHVTSRISPDSDEHHAVAGPGGNIFTLNFSHGTVTRYDLTRAQPASWRIALPGARPPQPYDGAFVPGGWRWP
jgi:DNA-binding beta-propeller fold protein YncE